MSSAGSLSNCLKIGGVHEGDGLVDGADDWEVEGDGNSEAGGVIDMDGDSEADGFDDAELEAEIDGVCETDGVEDEEIEAATDIDGDSGIDGGVPEVETDPDCDSEKEGVGATEIEVETDCA